MDQTELAASRQPPASPATDPGSQVRAAPSHAANEDTPTGGHLYRLISRRPSPTIIYSALTITAFYLGVIAAYIGGLYGPQGLANIPLNDMMLIGTVVLAPMLFLWLGTYLIWQSQMMRLMSEGLARTAIRLTEPEDIASEQIATVAQAVRREIDHMKAGVDSTLEQATSLNALLSRQLESLEAGSDRAEYRARAIEEVLTRNRSQLEEIAHTLGSEADTISRAIRTQVDAVRGISQKAEQELDEAATRLSGETETLARVSEAAAASSGATANMLERQSSRLEIVAETALAKANELSAQYERQRGAVMESVNRLEEGRAQLDTAFLAQRAHIEEMAQTLAARSQDVDKTVAGFAGQIDKTTTNLASQIEGALHAAENRTRDVAKTFATHVSTIINAAEEAASTVGTIARGTTETVTQATDTLHKTALSLGKNAAALGEEVQKNAAALHTDLDTRNKDMRATLQSTANEIEQAGEQLGATMFRIGGAAKDAGRSLHSAAHDLENRMEKLPEEAAAGAKTLREALEEQVSALAAIAEVVVRHARTLDKTSPAPELTAAAPQQPRQTQPPTIEAQLAPQFGPPVMRGASTLEELKKKEQQADEKGKSRRWGIPDLLAAANRSDNPVTANKQPGDEATEHEFHRTSLHVIETLQSIAIDLDRALEQSPPVELWHRYQAGERNVFTRRLYNLNGRELYDQIALKYRDDREFRDNVDRFIRLFERLLTAASERDRDNILVETYLTSDTGKVYLMLAQASGHLS